MRIGGQVFQKGGGLSGPVWRGRKNLPEAGCRGGSGECGSRTGSGLSGCGWRDGADRALPGKWDRKGRVSGRRGQDIISGAGWRGSCFVAGTVWRTDAIPEGYGRFCFGDGSVFWSSGAVGGGGCLLLFCAGWRGSGMFLSGRVRVSGGVVLHRVVWGAGRALFSGAVAVPPRSDGFMGPDSLPVIG